MNTFTLHSGAVIKTFVLKSLSYENSLNSTLMLTVSRLAVSSAGVPLVDRCESHRSSWFIAPPSAPLSFISTCIRLSFLLLHFIFLLLFLLMRLCPAHSRLPCACAVVVDDGRGERTSLISSLSFYIVNYLLTTTNDLLNQFIETKSINLKTDVIFIVMS